MFVTVSISPYTCKLPLMGCQQLLPNQTTTGSLKSKLLAIQCVKKVTDILHICSSFSVVNNREGKRPSDKFAVSPTNTYRRTNSSMRTCILLCNWSSQMTTSLRLPWPPSCCPYQPTTPFFSSEECCLIWHSVHPTSPLLLTKNGQLVTQYSVFIFDLNSRHHHVDILPQCWEYLWFSWGWWKILVKDQSTINVASVFFACWFTLGINYNVIERQGKV